MKKVVYLGKSARSSIIRGINSLSAVVKTTLGPEGTNALIDSYTMYPRITKDGVTVAKEFELPNKAENLAVKSLKESASRTEDEAGDGTTTSIILAQSICQQSLEAREKGHSVVNIKAGIKKAYEFILDRIKSQSEKISNNEQIKSVATISSNNDEEVGKLVHDAVIEIGKYGTVMVEESRGLGSSVEIVKGYSVDRGFLSPYFMTHPEQELVLLEKPYVLLYKERLEMSKELVSVLEYASSRDRSLLIISDNVSPDVMAMLTVNKMRGGLKVCAISPPYHGDRRWDVCEDMEVISGAKMLDSTTISELQPDLLGELEKVEIRKARTSIVSKKSKKGNIEKHVASLKDKLSTETRTHFRDSYKERISKLEGGIAIIKVGGHTEAEMIERKYRVSDAQLATLAALQEGVVPGGGLFFLLCLRHLRALRSKIPEEERIGVDIMMKAIQEPFNTIVKNAGRHSVLEVFDLLLDVPDGVGYNAKTGEIEDMKKAGILDPAKVVRCALDNAVSVSMSLLTTDVIIVYEDDEKIRKGLE